MGPHVRAAVRDQRRLADVLAEVKQRALPRGGRGAGVPGARADRQPLAKMQKAIDAGNSDLFDVLAYVAFAAAPVTRELRAAAAKAASALQLTNPQRAFADFVLAQYVRQGG